MSFTVINMERPDFQILLLQIDVNFQNTGPMASQATQRDRKSTSWWLRGFQKRTSKGVNVDLEDPQPEANRTASRLSVSEIDRIDRTELTENIHSILKNESTKPPPDSVDIPEFILDIVVFNVEDKRRFRRLLLDLKSQFNIMALTCFWANHPSLKTSCIGFAPSLQVR